jgi:hypothetical protein
MTTSTSVTWRRTAGADRILRFANPTSGRVLTTIEVRETAKLGKRESEDEDN